MSREKNFPLSRIGSSFTAENLLVLGILSVLLGIFAGSCVLVYGFHWLFAGVPLGVGVICFGLALLVRRRS